MTTFVDDFVRIETRHGGVATVFLPALGLEWPPPPILTVAVLGQALGEFVRASMSEITDDQRAGMTHVCRGARYVPVVTDEEAGL